MLRVLIAITLVALGLVSVSAQTYPLLPVSFCERYSTATNASETDLIRNVVLRALVGGSGNGVTVVGILNRPEQMAIFNGSYASGTTNYYANNVLYNSLVSKLINFFGNAMACRAMTITPVADMAGVHGAMKINKALWDQFVGEVVNSLLSFGVPSGSGATSDITYAAALLGQFLKGAPQAICTQTDCADYSPFDEFFVFGSSTAGFKWFKRDGSSDSMSIAVGGTVHWNFNGNHNVQQTDSSYQDLAGGFSSGAPTSGINSYTRTFTTAGTYYFTCINHRSSMRGTIVVGTPPSAAASALPSAISVFAVAIAAVMALRRF